jgi:hypothetical protein
MPKPTPFAIAVIKILKASGRGMDAHSLRIALMKQGWGKHPAAVACHLTKLAWKKEFVCSYCGTHGQTFMLTEAGKNLPLDSDS